MKIYKLFTLVMAAMAFTACGDNDVIDGQDPDNQAPENWEANMEGLTINFGTASGPTTRDYSGETPSEGTEAVIYDAYVFAREANPGHLNPLEGDWTVIKCKVNDDNIVEGDSQVDNPDGTKTLKNVATFHGVRQGDFVYVIANDPNMTLDLANSLAHQGAKSENNIKNYTSMLAKNYLGGLNFGADKPKPEGKFFMGGLAQIPVAPTLPSNGTLELEVGLDRELSKVLFQANVTATPSDAAYQRVEFREGDGIVVARIAPTTSMFAERETNFYVPAPSCTEDWPINSHTLVDGVFSKFCDQTIEGSVMFDGMAENAFSWNGVNVADHFNLANPAGDVQEYRYSWVLPAGTVVGAETQYGTQTQNLAYGNTKSLYASTFYTTPNYGANVNGTTVICTQATYIGKDEFLNDGFNKAVDLVLANDGQYIEFPAPDGSASAKIVNPLYVNVDGASADENKASTIKYLASLKKLIGREDASKVGTGLGMKYIPEANGEDAAAFAAILTAHGLDASATYDLVDTWEYNGKNANLANVALTREIYETMMDQFYASVVLQYRAMQEIIGVEGTMLTEFGNRIPKNVTAYYCDPAADNKDLMPTDALLTGNLKNHFSQLWIEDETVLDGRYPGYKKGVNAPDNMLFYVYNDAADIAVDPAKYETYASIHEIQDGKALRLKYFASADAFKYFQNMKLYYRADVANYVGDTSNKITERNMYYRTIGTIQSLGARTIHDAIYSEENTMKVNVTVNKWKLSINQIPM